MGILAIALLFICTKTVNWQAFNTMYVEKNITNLIVTNDIIVNQKERHKRKK
jgi:hypothetical protein